VLAENELEELRARCRRQSTVIHTLGELVANFKVGAAALKAENRALRAENDRLRGRPSAPTDAQRTGAEPTEAAIPLDARAPGVARSIVAQCLGLQVAPPMVETAQLVVSELVTNSVRHSGLPDGQDVVVRVSLAGERCRVEVEDPGCDGVIAPQPRDPDEAAGSGLIVVQALSERWGVVRAAGGPTRVWAQLPCAAPLADPRRSRPTARRDPGPAVAAVDHA
jgi:anti-sigma regulatory factor (Ser/Thr protein kinase)